MINSISGSSPIAQAQHAQQHQQNVQAPKKNAPDQQDSVVLSSKASKAGDAAKGDPDHDGH
jgi:hypothetical protein